MHSRQQKIWHDTMKILHATAKTWYSQINKYFLKLYRILRQSAQECSVAPSPRPKLRLRPCWKGLAVVHWMAEQLVRCFFREHTGNIPFRVPHKVVRGRCQCYKTTQVSTHLHFRTWLRAGAGYCRSLLSKHTGTRSKSLSLLSTDRITMPAN